MSAIFSVYRYEDEKGAQVDRVSLSYCMFCIKTGAFINAAGDFTEYVVKIEQVI